MTQEKWLEMAENVFRNDRERFVYQCLLIRMAEQKIIELYPSDKIQSPVHLSIGQEAVAVGLCAALRPDDLLFPTYRNHALFLAKGGTLRAFFAELFGKETGGARGKAGSMHMLAPECGLMPATAVVASNLPVAVGAALAERRKGGTRLVAAVFGDGATEEGVHHESLNMAAILNLPVLFVCEDNGYAVHAPVAQRQSYDLPALVARYGIGVSEIADGHDPEAVRDSIAATIAAMRADGRPRYVVVKTYRYKEHVGPGDDFDAGYRSPRDLQSWLERDPLLRESEIVERLRPRVAAEIAEAVAFAEASPWPPLSSLHDLQA